jgi:hypothetical protein
MCGGDAIRFQLDSLGVEYFHLGTQNAWVGAYGQEAIAGNPTLSDAEVVFAGTSNNPGWIISSSDDVLRNVQNETFASSYDNNAVAGPSFDYCNGDSFDPVYPPLEWLFYR